MRILLPSCRVPSRLASPRVPPSGLPFALAQGLVLTLALQSPVATAQLVKCDGDAGRIVYQDTPCAAGKELRNFDTDPGTVSVIPLRPINGTTTRLAAPSTARRSTGGSDKKEKGPRGDAAERKYLHPGMHEGEVLARAGPPDLKSGGGSRKHARWTYMPVPADAQTITTVLFDGGKVIEVERKVVK
jgi:Domain of unknown function (DUF4124)